MHWDDFNCADPAAPARMLQTTVYESVPDDAARQSLTARGEIGVARLGLGHILTLSLMC